ncbi:MAG: ABC transporter substrate-binding protein [Propionibacteriaceae bacterium]
MRIVSLLPSATEIVYALGLDDDLVGVTFECNEPPRARTDKRIIVGGRDTSTMEPGAIDAYVREQFAAGADLYTLHEDALADLDPDLILTQDLCRVCAVPTGKVREAVDHLGCAAEVLTLDPYSLTDVLDTITAVAETTGRGSAGATLRRELEERLAVVRERVAGTRRRRVAVVEWVDPPFGAGHWMPEMVEAAGGEPVACSPAAPSTETTWAEVRAADPEVVVVSPCGFGLDGALTQSAAVRAELPDAEVWAIDGDGLMVRPGPRLVEGVEALAGILHPDLFPRHPGTRIVG